MNVLGREVRNILREIEKWDQKIKVITHNDNLNYGSNACVNKNIPDVLRLNLGETLIDYDFEYKTECITKEEAISLIKSLAKDKNTSVGDFTFTVKTLRNKKQRFITQNALKADTDINNVYVIHENIIVKCTFREANAFNFKRYESYSEAEKELKELR